MEEVVLNDYSLVMNLTIRSLEKKDFGGYICKSSNALGKAEGTVRLRGNHIDKLIYFSNWEHSVILLEVNIPIESTSAATTPKNIDTKPRKIMGKDKQKKQNKSNHKKKELLAPEEEVTTNIAHLDSKIYIPTQTSMPTLKKQPQWIYRSGSGKSALGWGILTCVIIWNIIWEL